MGKMMTVCGILGAMTVQAGAAGPAWFSPPAGAEEIKMAAANDFLKAPVRSDAEKRNGLCDLDEPNDPKIRLGMYEHLQKAGIRNPLIDVRELVKPEAEKTLLKHGFARQPDTQGLAIYTLGNARLYGIGQRAAVNNDGSASLVCFSQPPGGHPILEIIIIDAYGKVHNTATKVP